MNRSFVDDDLYDAMDDLGGNAPHMRNIPRKKTGGKARPVRPHNVVPVPPSESLAEQSDNTFHMSYKAARHEALWLEDSLRDFFSQQWFDDVLRVVKGGKEASVYLCQGNVTSGEEFVAAKVYRPRRFRNLKNDWLYREGRANLDESGHKVYKEGELNAIRRRTDFGRELMHTSWLEHEFLTLSMLHKAGADVPKPFASSQNAILMSYYGDEVMGAPTLNEVSLPTREAYTLFDRVIHNIDLMLSLGRIHGDLSAFNILYWEGEIVLIDFPQTISPEENRSAFPIFQRDVTRICEYFQRQGVHSRPRQLAADLWQRHQHLFIPLVDPKALGEDNDDERDIWASLRNR